MEKPMTVWMLHLPLTAAEEQTIASRDTLPLPLDGLPDLSFVHHETQFRHLLQALHPGLPPESIGRLQERLWRIYAGVQPEDVIAVPLPHLRKVAVAEVAGGYRYAVGAAGDDCHAVAVKWQSGLIPFAKFRADKHLLDANGAAMLEVKTVEARNLIRSTLPRGYNRFAKWKWILAVFFTIKIIVLTLHQLRQ